MAASPPRLAATLVLVRDAPLGLEVLMVQRHHEIDFARGASVFPGGKVADADADERLAARCDTPALEQAARALRIAAIRETFEECGLLLARRRSDGAALSPRQVTAHGAAWRSRIAKDSAELVAFAQDEDLEIACGALLPFAHWVTPEISPKRFDTHFFLASAPGQQIALHDGAESVDAVWIRPADALRDAAARRRSIIFPTLANLNLLAQSACVSDALAAARTRPIVTIMPQLERRADGRIVPRLPEGTGYPPLPPELAELNVR